MVACIVSTPQNMTRFAPMAVVVSAWAATRQTVAREFACMGVTSATLPTLVAPTYSRRMSRKLIKTIDVDTLPGILREIAEATDIATALTVAALKGGTKAYFSRYPQSDSWLSEAVGHAKACKIGEALAPAGGITLLVPLGGHREFLRLQVTAEMVKQGHSKSEIARHLKLHERTIQRYRAVLRDGGFISGKKP